MADQEANDVLDLIDDAARRQIDRDLGALERLGDEADRLAGRIVSVATSLSELRSDPTSPAETDPSSTGETK